MELSEITAVSQRYLLQIAGKLRDGGLIGANRGMTGGFHLLQEPSHINVYDIIKYMEGGLTIPEHSGIALDDNKLLFEVTYLLIDYLNTFMRAMTINKFADESDSEGLTDFVQLIEKHIDSIKEKI